jgi:hypothetical protein
MIINDWIHTLAGFFILLSLSLGVESSPIFHSKYWLLFTVFVGLNLLQFGFSKYCPMGLILKALGVPEKRA